MLFFKSVVIYYAWPFFHHKGAQLSTVCKPNQGGCGSILWHNIEGNCGVWKLCRSPLPHLKLLKVKLKNLHTEAVDFRTGCRSVTDGGPTGNRAEEAHETHGKALM